MLFAYPDDPSVEAGSDLTLRVSASTQFRIAMYRWGQQSPARHARADESFCGTARPAGETGTPWDWPPYRIPIPPDWNGVYVAVLSATGKRVTTREDVDARCARALFVVRPIRPDAPIVFNVPLFTYHAYNVDLRSNAERTCLYNGGRSATIARPGGGTGGHLWDERNADAYDTTSQRQTFAHWDGKAALWLERHGFAVDYCTDLDLHRDPTLLERYRALVAFGHHEYWTDEMRTQLDSFIAAGGNAAFFTGNTCWFRVRYDESTQSFSRLSGRWDHDPETRTFGVSYAYGGGKWIGERPPTGYTVRRARDWIFDSTGLRDGETFGADERLIGYECDGAAAADMPGCSVLAGASLGEWRTADGSGELNDGARASMVRLQRHGILFAAGTTDWARVLASGNRVVGTITRNVLSRFLERAPEASAALAQE